VALFDVAWREYLNRYLRIVITPFNRTLR